MQHHQVLRTIAHAVASNPFSPQFSALCVPLPTASLSIISTLLPSRQVQAFHQQRWEPGRPCTTRKRLADWRRSRKTRPSLLPLFDSMRSPGIRRMRIAGYYSCPVGTILTQRAFARKAFRDNIVVLRLLSSACLIALLLASSLPSLLPSSVFSTDSVYLASLLVLY